MELKTIAPSCYKSRTLVVFGVEYIFIWKRFIIFSTPSSEHSTSKKYWKPRRQSTGEEKILILALQMLSHYK